MKVKLSLMVILVLVSGIGRLIAQPAQNVVLASGEPPLTQKMVDELNSFFAWSLDISLTESQRQMIKKVTIAAWNRKDRVDIDGTLEILELQTKLSQASPAERNVARENMQRDMLEALRADPTDEVSMMLLGVYGSAHAPEANILPIAGNPPLTRQLIDKGARLFEWLLDARLTEEQYQQFEASLIRSWRSNDPNEVASTLSIIKLHDDLGRKPEAEREAMREMLRSKYLELMAATPNDVGSQWALGIYYSAHTPIARGNPPLTRQAADAYAEVMSFMINEVLGGEVLIADKAYKDKLATSLAVQYPGLAPAGQMEFSQMPISWAAIRMTWPTLSESQKAGYRQQWASGVQALLPPVPKTVVATTPTAKTSKTASAARPARSTSNARQTIADYYRHEKTRQWLFDLNQDFIHKHILSPGWTYQKYSTW